MSRALCIAVSLLLLGCDTGGGMAPDDQPVDAGLDAGMDAGPVDAGFDAGPVEVDAGFDAGPVDAGIGCECDPTLGCSRCPNGTVCDLSDEICTAPRYSVNGDGTVTDDLTSLVWQQQLPSNPCPGDGAGVCTWQDAQSYCQNLSLGNPSSGWRLPTLDELFSLVDLGMTPTIDAEGFPTIPGAATCWTSTAINSNENWYVNFSAGYASANIDTADINVLCVR